MASKPIPEALHKPNNNHTEWLLRKVYDRVNENNEHFMGVIVGREGSGKSYTAIKLANHVDPTFNADRVIFDVAELLKVLQEEEHEPGNFYVLDEAGVQLGRRTWQDRAQVLANQALQLIRSHNLGLVFTLPRLSELDSQTVGRLQAILEVVEKVPEQYVKVKWKWVDPDRIDNNGNVLKKYPRRRQDGYLKRVTGNTIAPPQDDELIEAYEAEKEEFQQDMYEETIAALEGREEEETEDKASPKDVAETIKDGKVASVVSEHGVTGEPYVNHQLIRMEYDLSHQDAKAVKSMVENDVELTEEMI